MNNKPHTTPADELETIKSQYLDDLNLNLERLKMLQAVIDDVAHALHFANQYAHKELIDPANIRLGIGQLLAMDFINSLQNDIAKMEGNA